MESQVYETKTMSSDSLLSLLIDENKMVDFLFI